MTPYLLSTAWFFVVFGACVLAKSPRMGLVIGMLPMLGVALLRGRVGVDLPAYEYVADLVRDTDGLVDLYEPLFELLILFLVRLSDDSAIVMIIVSAVTCVILIAGSVRSGQRAIVVGLALLPYFFFDMTMNGIRYGLAFSIVLFASSQLVRGRAKTYMALVLVAALVQLSALVLGTLLYALMAIKVRRIVALAVLLGLTAVIVREYLLAKVEANAGLVVQSQFAGLAPLLLTCLLLLVLFLLRRQIPNLATRLPILAALALTAYGITQFFYVGMRVQQLVLFLAALYLISQLEVRKAKLTRAALLVLWGVGLAGAGLRLKNFYNDANQGDAPFAPYSFYWERA